MDISAIKLTICQFPYSYYIFCQGNPFLVGEYFSQIDHCQRNPFFLIHQMMEAKKR